MALDIQERESLAEAEETAIEVPFVDEQGNVQYQDDGVTPIATFITGQLSTRYRRVQAAWLGRAMRAHKDNASANGKVTNIAEPAEAITLMPEEQEAIDATEGARSIQMNTDAVAACMTGWTPGFVAGGQPLPFTRANAVRLLKAYPHYQVKLQEAMADHERFFAKRSTT